MKSPDTRRKYVRHLATVLILAIISASFLKCTPENVSRQFDDEGVVNQMPYHWKSSISDGPLGSNLYKEFTVQGNGVIFLGKRKSQDAKYESFLGVKDFNSGKNVWIWDGFYDKKLSQVLHDHLTIADNNILINDLGVLYSVDGQTGRELWKNREHGSFSNISAVENMFFFSAIASDGEKNRKVADIIYKGDVKSGKMQPLVKPTYSEEFAKKEEAEIFVGATNWLKAFKNDKEVLLIIPFEEMGPKAKYSNLRSFFGLYNVSENQWVYDRVPLSLVEEGSSQSVMPQVVGDKVYLTSLATVGCFDLMTGKRVWQRRVSDVHTGIFDMLVAEDRVIVNVHNAEMHCLDAATGDLYWTQKSSGISSAMYYQDGVVYWIPSKNLRAVDVQTGQILWDLPTMDKESGSIWRGFVTGTPARGGDKGRIYATSDLYMYCFDAAK